MKKLYLACIFILFAAYLHAQDDNTCAGVDSVVPLASVDELYEVTVILFCHCPRRKCVVDNYCIDVYKVGAGASIEVVEDQQHNEYIALDGNKKIVVYPSVIDNNRVRYTAILSYMDGSNGEVAGNGVSICKGICDPNKNNGGRNFKMGSGGCYTNFDNDEIREKEVIEDSELTGYQGLSINVSPNPTNGILNLHIKAPESNSTIIEIFNALGKRIYAVSPYILKGEYKRLIQFPNNTPSGTYMVRVKVGQYTATQKVVVIKP